MLHPSYGELLDDINETNKNEGLPEIHSRYTLVMALSKRARDLVDGDPVMVEDTTNGRVLSQAIHEAETGKLGVKIEDTDDCAIPEDAEGMTDVDLSTKIDDEE